MRTLASAPSLFTRVNATPRSRRSAKPISVACNATPPPIGVTARSDPPACSYGAGRSAGPRSSSTLGVNPSLRPYCPATLTNPSPSRTALTALASTLSRLPYAAASASGPSVSGPALVSSIVPASAPWP